MVRVPRWITDLRKEHVVNPILGDPRATASGLLGFSIEQVEREVVGGGQADFDKPWGPLSAADRALLYAYLNQLGHLEELSAAFQMLFSKPRSLHDPVVLDLGAGPCTGGLALAGALGDEAPFTYLGVDRSATMRALGEHLAISAEAVGQMTRVTRTWHDTLSSIVWPHVPGWRPVIVIVSYLLASPTVDPAALVAEVGAFLEKVGRGPVAILYTNSTKSDANRSFPVFREALAAAGFAVIVDERGSITTARKGERALRDALFFRPARLTLSPDET